MEKILKDLLDYQRFEKNPRLEKLIAETESRLAGALSDDELTQVNAAGDFSLLHTSAERKKEDEIT